MTHAARTIALALLVGCPRAKPPPPPPPPGEPTDFAQADKMLELLAATPPPTGVAIDAVMALPGTELIIQQQNLSRHVTAAQYRIVLAAFAAAAPPALAPAADDERAKRGVAGLRDNVWPALHWGAANGDVLAARVAAIKKLDASAAAIQQAVEWLPEPAPPAVHLHVVMGGRAGAAAIDHDIYFDVLATSFKASLGVMTYPSDAEIVEYFAHETHHVGLGPVIDKQRQQLALTEAAGRAYDLLASLVMEGSATYLINAHHDLARMRGDPQYEPHLADPDRLLAMIARLLDDTTDHGLAGDAYEKAISPLVESGFHAAGALMLDAIYRTDGKPAVLAVMRDPRRLLVEFNAAAVLLGVKGEPLRPFEGALTERVAHLGER